MYVSVSLSIGCDGHYEGTDYGVRNFFPFIELREAQKKKEESSLKAQCNSSISHTHPIRHCFRSQNRKTEYYREVPSMQLTNPRDRFNVSRAESSRVE